MVHSNRSCTLQAVKRRTDPLLLFLFFVYPSVLRQCSARGVCLGCGGDLSVGKWGFAQCYGGRCCESVAIYYIQVYPADAFCAYFLWAVCCRIQNFCYLCIRFDSVWASVRTGSLKQVENFRPKIWLLNYLYLLLQSKTVVKCRCSSVGQSS